MARDNENAGAVIAGRNPVREALERGDVQFEKVYLQRGLEGRPIAQLHGLARAAGVPVQFVPQGRLNELAGGASHQGVVAVVAPVAYLDLDDLLTSVADGIDAVRAVKPILLMLDEIQDPHNFGAILRSAVGAGASGVIVPERNMAPLSATAVKSSAGAALRIPIARVGNLAQAAIQLKERGYWVIGAAGEATQTVWEANWDRPIVLVVGSEGTGIREGLRKACDELVAIPIRGPVESLNASVAAGVVLFAAVRER
ncbi:MAG TPA: 23S rRNA (guanosine(2251)-2'-O)-methyltransferase RlmB [Rhodothermales bacterium]